MKIDFDIEGLFDEDGDPVDMKSTIRDDIINEVANKVLHQLSAPSYELKTKVEKLIKENLHSLTIMGIERFIAEKGKSINSIIDDEISKSFSVAKWNSDQLPTLIENKIAKLMENRKVQVEREMVGMFEEKFKTVLENLLDIAFKNFVETAGINTIWVSGKKR